MKLFLMFASLTQLLTLAQAGEVIDRVGASPSVNFHSLFLYRLGTGGSTTSTQYPDGFTFQALNLGIRGPADGFFTGDILFAADQITYGTFSQVIEEATIETGLIHRFRLKLGKFRSLFGPYNNLRRYEQPFIDAPYIHRQLLGENGLNQPGLSFVYSMSFLPWHSEFSEHFFTPTDAAGVSGATLFNTSNPTNFGGVFYWRNKFRLGDSSHLQFDIGAAYGPGPFANVTHVYEVGLGLKLGRFRWMADYLYALRKGAPTLERRGGVSTMAQFQFADLWWLQARYDLLGLPAAEDGTSSWASFLVGHVPSNYAAFRVQYDLNPISLAQRVQLQLNIGLGPEPAHAYTAQ